MQANSANIFDANTVSNNSSLFRAPQREQVASPYMHFRSKGNLNHQVCEGWQGTEIMVDLFMAGKSLTHSRGKEV